jgi:arsenate reductase-like glutaredoxin family protein
MKEVFDVSYAVHRMGEERAKRKEIKKLLQQQSSHIRLQTINSYLPALDDDSDDEYIMITGDNDSNTSSSSNETGDKRHEHQFETLCKTLDSQIALDNEKVEKDNVIKKLAGNLMMEAPPVVNQRVRSGFHLNMNNATLLERRKNTSVLEQQE